MRFPAVTLCNINPLKYAHVKNDKDLMPAIQAVAARWNIKLDDFEEDNTYDVCQCFQLVLRPVAN